MNARANILVVEDSRAAATRLQRSLEQGQFSVELARNGAEAHKKAQRKQFDAVITDEQMPIMSGRELCRELRNDERYAHIPIIFLTANQTALDPEELREELGVSVVFGKPFRPEVIVRVVENELLNHRKSARANSSGSASATTPDASRRQAPEPSTSARSSPDSNRIPPVERPPSSHDLSNVIQSLRDGELSRS